jgi:chaperonin cofactor prefoldin
MKSVIPARLATLQELEEFPKALNKCLVLEEGRTIAVKPIKALPNDTEIYVTVGPNVVHILDLIVTYTDPFC